MDMTRESDFSRSLANHAKLGAYYTDLAHCEAISRFLQFPEEDVLCLEPSIGDGKAIKTCTGKTEGDSKHIYGVEINQKTCRELNEDPLLDGLLCADFLHGVTISPSVFSFCFSNPPYMAQDETRTEELFFDKINGYMKAGGVLVYVIPYSVFTSRGFFTKLYNRYDLRHVYRFHAGEYEKWKQVCIIGVKRAQRRNILKDERDTLLAAYSEEKIMELPFDYEGEPVEVPASDLSLLKTFTTIRFPVEDCLSSMENGFAKETVSNFFEMMANKIKVRAHDNAKERTAPIHPNKDSMYLLGVCGVGSGLCGDAGERNLHLQRGVVKMVEDLHRQTDEKGNEVVIATTRAQVTYKVVQADGTISVLV